MSCFSGMCQIWLGLLRTYHIHCQERARLKKRARLMVWPIARIKNMKPSLPWMPPTGECNRVPSQWKNATTALRSVSMAKTESHRVTGDFCLASLCTQFFQPKCSWRCHAMLAKKQMPTATWSQTHITARLPVASSWMLEASIKAVDSNSRLSHKRNFSTLVIGHFKI